MLKRIINRMLEHGVSMVDHDKVYIEAEVKIGRDVTLYPFVALLGKTEIGDNSVIGPGIVLKDKYVKPNSKIFSLSDLEDG